MTAGPPIPGPTAAIARPRVALAAAILLDPQSVVVTHEREGAAPLGDIKRETDPVLCI